MEMNTYALLGIAIMNAITAYMAYRTKQQADTIEKATNSMKDALVATTARASLAEGKEQGRIEEVARTASP